MEIFMFTEAFEVRDKIKDNPYLQDWCRSLKEKSDILLHTKIAEYTRNEYNRFYRDGNTLAFGKKYFDRRARLACFSMMVFIYRDKAFIPPLEAAIRAVCDEFTWVLPEHIAESNTDYRGFIDLFAAETGLALSELKYLLSGELSDEIKELIHSEVHERIITPYLDESKEFAWYTRTNNWAAVCSAGCAISAMYEGSAAKAASAIQKTEKIMKNFLSGFSSEGVCTEGYAYWTYGFGFFTAYADLVKKYTKGAINHFASERVRCIASFVKNGIIRDGTQLTFSDASPTDNAVSMGLEFFYSAMYDEIDISAGGWQPFGQDTSYRFILMDRTFVWATYYADRVTKKAPPKSSLLYYPDAQWYIRKAPAYILCAKGGNNGESHNHNDLGSFYIDNYRTQVLADIGSGEYTEQYFSPRRYELLVCSSEGHSLPIINGKFQLFGTERRAKILKADSGCFSAELSSAYGLPELDSLVRTLEPHDDCVLVTDTFSGRLSSVTERFVSLIKPTVTADGVVVENALLTSSTMPQISERVFSGPRGEEQTAWLIDYEKNGDFSEYTFKLSITFTERTNEKQ